MRVYTVHVLPNSVDYKELVLVREGFCWPAFFFDVFWALYHRAWISVLILAAAIFLFERMSLWLSITEPVFMAAFFGWRCFVGFHGNDWRRRALTQRGFEMSGVTTGTDYISAVQRFLDSGDELGRQKL